MTKRVFFLQFKGNAIPIPGSPGVMTATTSASGCTMATALEADGPSGSLQAGGGDARFKSVVTMTGEGRFVESGTIEYGAAGSVSFVTAGEGVIGASAVKGLTTGSVIWKIVKGTGAMEGASGYITSNFSVDGDGAVLDNQLAVMLLP